MRKFLIAVAIAGGLASIALCSLYGWKQATALEDRLIAAVTYGLVALFALSFDMLAIRLWVNGWNKCSVFIAIVAFLAFAMTATTSLGGMVSRSDRITAERKNTLRDEDRIADLTAEKQRMGKVTPADQSTVEVATRQADAATAAKIAECSRRGPECRKKEDAEQKALDSLKIATDNKKATDRLNAIEKELKDLRARRSNGEAVAAVNPLGATLALIIGSTADVMTAKQQAIFAIIFDLGLVALMVGIEALGHVPQTQTRLATKSETIDVPQPIVAPDLIIAAEPPIIDITPKPEPPAPELKPQLPVRPRPKLAATTRKPIGAVLDFLHDGTEIVAGASTEMAHAFLGYAAWCKARSLRPMSVADFVDAMEKDCRRVGIRIVVEGDLQYLMDVQLGCEYRRNNFTG